MVDDGDDDDVVAVVVVVVDNVVGFVDLLLPLLPLVVADDHNFA